MRSSSLVRVLVLCVLAAAPAYGQEAEAQRAPGVLFAVPPDGPLASLAERPSPQVPAAPAIVLPDPPVEKRRSPAFVPLYSSLVTLNALDVHSTLKGLGSGEAREANPMMRPFVERPAAFIALKAGLSAATIWMTEKSRKKHPKRALVTLIVSNAAMAAIVAHNYRVVRQAR